MALFFYDGLEASRTTATLTDTFDSVHSSIPASQSYASCPGRIGGLGMAVTGAELLMGVDSPADSKVTAGVGFQFPSVLAGQTAAIEIYDTNGLAGSYATFAAIDDGDGNFHVEFTDGLTIQGNSGPIKLDTSKWYFMEVQVSGLTSVLQDTKAFECRINRDTVILRELSGILLEWETAALRVTPGAGTVNIDDFYVLDSATGNRTFLGPEYTVSTQYPDTDGDIAEWTVVPASQTHADAVDDNEVGEVDDDLSYVVSDSDTTLDLFQMSSGNELGGHVVDSRVEVYARTDDAGSGEPLPVVTQFRGAALEVQNIALPDAYARTAFSLGGLPGTTKGLSPEDLRHFQAGVGDASVADAPGGSIGIGNYNVVFFYLDDWGIDSCSLYHDQNPYRRASGTKYSKDDLEDILVYPRTPAMDAMAAEGITFDNFRATPVCSSGRWAILTGRYPFRHGCGEVPTNNATNYFECGVDPLWEEFPISQIIKTNGYRSALTGKAHFMAWDNTGSGTHFDAGDPPTGVAGQGWSWLDDYSYFDHYAAVFHNVPVAPPVPQPGAGTFTNYFVYRNDTEASGGPGIEIAETQYITNRQHDDAKAFLTTNAEQKFLLYVPFNAPHSPSTRSDDYYTTDSYRTAANGDPQISNGSLFHNFNICVETIDLRIAELRSWMQANHPAAYDRTVWIVAGDNGTFRQAMNNGRTNATAFANAELLAPGVAELHPDGDKNGINLGTDYDAMLDAPMDQFKESVYDRGILCPLIISGPSALVNVPPGGRRCDALVDCVDLFTLIAELTNSDPADTIPDDRILDGVSMLPLLVDQNVDLDTHARQYSFSAYFRPNGNVNDILPPEVDPSNVVRLAYCLNIGGNLWKLIRYLDTEEVYNLTTDPYEIGGSLPLSGTEYDALKAGMDALLASEPRINGGGVLPGTLKKPFTDSNGLAGEVVLDENDKVPIIDFLGVAGTVDSVGGTHIPITDYQGAAGTVLLTGTAAEGQTILPTIDSSGVVSKVLLAEPSNDLPITDHTNTAGQVTTDGVTLPITDSAGVAGSVALQEE